ncbi:APO protein 4, mitochondrial isoform X3 [Cryptomeria japonica]|uniref:APO protein 4, mitochondrial isoform X3 n=1 Tax=Cryptomeria japonica TaxID=3369 RepID=UPI0027DA7665|nr:APO protein 4, mitochondrial isoform X3 [Cryptomeria japonica]XP_059073022.1 APO protein 4, mitochondrial isoform X3 [Cryptomeria japonica]
MRETIFDEQNRRSYMCGFGLQMQYETIAAALQFKNKWSYLQGKAHNCLMYVRSYKSKVDYKSKGEWKRLRPMILERIKQRAKYYPIPYMVPIAHEVLKARAVLIEGVSKLLKLIPVKACRTIRCNFFGFGKSAISSISAHWHCSEVFVGHTGHHILTCRGPKHGARNLMHVWMEGNIDDIVVPLEAFHLYDMFQDVIKHDNRFDFDRVPAIMELCIQAGVNLPEHPTKRISHFHNMDCGRNFQSSDHLLEDVSEASVNAKLVESSSFPEELGALAEKTLQAWETMRLGTKKLMFVYPVKVCKYCPEVHVGPSGHKARLCGIFKYESYRRHHMWKTADLDDFIPPRYVWHKHEQDPVPLLDEGRGFYGHAPAVVEMCVQAGAVIPRKYHRQMKINVSGPDEKRDVMHSPRGNHRSYRFKEMMSSFRSVFNLRII